MASGGALEEIRMKSPGMTSVIDFVRMTFRFEGSVSRRSMRRTTAVAPHEQTSALAQAEAKESGDVIWEFGRAETYGPLGELSPVVEACYQRFLRAGGPPEVPLRAPGMSLLVDFERMAVRLEGSHCSHGIRRSAP